MHRFTRGLMVAGTERGWGKSEWRACRTTLQFLAGIFEVVNPAYADSLDVVLAELPGGERFDAEATIIGLSAEGEDSDG